MSNEKLYKVTVPSVYTPQNYLVLSQPDGESKLRVTVVFGMSNLTINVGVKELRSALRLLCGKE